MENLTTVDFAVIEQLARETSESLVRDLLKEFCDGLPQKIDQCRQGLAVNDHVGVARNAHVLKSEARTFGAHALGHKLQSLETACAGDPGAVNTLALIEEAGTLADAYISAVTQAQF